MLGSTLIQSVSLSRIERVLNLDPAKLLVIAAVAVILLGPDRLPQVARQVGAAWRSLTDVRHRMETEVRSSIPDLPSSSEIARLARSPSALLDHLSNMSPDADGTPVTPSAPQSGGPPERGTPCLSLRAPHSERERVPTRGPGSGRPRPELIDRHVDAVTTRPRIARQEDLADEMNVSEHLGELRRRLIVCVAAFIVTSLISVVAYEPILHFLIRPLCDVDASSRHQVSASVLANHGTCNLFVTSPLDGLSLRVKIAVFGGLVLALPVILFEMWRFVTPGLQTREKRYAVPFVVASCALFVLGAATAYLTLPHALHFLESVGGPDLRAIYDPIPYLGLIILMMTLFGLRFSSRSCWSHWNLLVSSLPPGCCAHGVGPSSAS